VGFLTKSQKLGLKASDSLRFAHSGGPFASPGWVPQKVHDDRSKELFKALITQGSHPFQLVEVIAKVGKSHLGYQMMTIERFFAD
jgi:hypothetical protein